MYHSETTLNIDKSLIVKEDEATYHSRCSGALIRTQVGTVS